jgi:tetratricopeptide (TPR) repeat protein
LQWGDAESQNLMAALKFAADSQNHSVVSQLSIVTCGYLLVRSRWSDLADSLNIGVTSAKAIKDAKAEAWNLILLDVVHLSLEHFDMALRTSIRALRIAQKLPDRWCEGAALHDLGMAFDGLGRLDEAVAHLRRALDIYRAIEDRRGEGTVLSLLGDVLRRQQDFDSAEIHALQGLSIHRSTKNLLGEAYALRQVSRLYADTGRVDKAIDSLSAAAESFSQLQYRYERARALQELGSIESDIGRRDEARAHWQEALAILQELKHSQAPILQSRLESLGGT